MIDGKVIVGAALGYLSVLFLIAWLGDRRTRKSSGAANPLKGRPVLYALSLAVYCTSWTFFGSVGLAGETGLDFIPVYLGPILMFTIGWPLLVRIVRLAKSQNTTSIADFLAARYGKSQALSATVTVVALLGTLPYISLQLKAVSISLETMIGNNALSALTESQGLVPIDLALSVAIVMAVFAILFGTRHIDATEHQQGLMLAVATESLVKITAFLAVGIFTTWIVFDGLADLASKGWDEPEIRSLFSSDISLANWLATTLLSFVCILLLPRQFHVAVVENYAEAELKRAAWLFPIYLIAINLFVIPIAIAGLLLFPKGSVNGDTFVLAVPLGQGAHALAMLAFIGGLSAATAMVIVESVALALMVCNGIAVPLMLHRQDGNEQAERREQTLGPMLIMIRRIVILLIMGLAYLFYRTLGQSGALASIGLLSFAAIAQLAPSFFIGLFWRRGTARGAIAGIVAGAALWSYTLLLPWIVRAGWMSGDILADGPWGLGALRPQALLGSDLHPLAHGVFWSLCVNTLAYIGVSLLRQPEPIERLQANIFILDDQPRGVLPAFRLWRTSITVDDLRRTVSRYLGSERTDRAFAAYAKERGGIELLGHAEADIQLLRFTEHVLASAIGASSARLVLSLLLRRKSVGNQSALRLLDDASEALQYNRDLLQSALDQVRQGLAVFDRDMQLICWNRQFREILELPAELATVGAPIDRVIRYLAERGDLGTGNVEVLVRDRVHKLAVTKETYQERRILGGKRVLEVRTSAMPQGGFVTTYSDITERVAASDALERRVRERTAELTKVNQALAQAKSVADDANLAKTRFLAAASHDILQPLNAARLYASSLVESSNGGEPARLAASIDTSLEAVEEILGTLIEISRLDSGHLAPEITILSLGDILEQMRVEFEPAAQAKGIDLRIVATRAHVRSDRVMLRRIVQNLLANAIKYTETGKVLVGCRYRNGSVVLQVSDTGPGIPAEKQALVFKEFERLPNSPAGTRGLGLGLSIVERMSRVLDHPISLVSRVGGGSTFYLTLPSAPAMEQDRGEKLDQTIQGMTIGRMTALCIDNEEQILDGMRTLLSTWGVTALCSQTGTGVIAAVAAAGTVPDVILADYHLDSGTGLEAIAEIRRAAGSQVPAVIITADSSPEITSAVRGAGHIILRKPVKPAPLRAVLSQLNRLKDAAE